MRDQNTLIQVALTGNAALRVRLLVLVLALCATCSGADTPSALGLTTTLRVDVQEVRLTLFATDARGGTLTNLSAGDFQLFDDDQGVNTLLAFTRCTDQHLRIALLVDSSDSLRNRREIEREVLAQFARGLSHEDDVVVESFASRQVIARDAVSQVSRQQSGNGTALYDALVSASKRLKVDSEHPLPVIIVISDGEDTVSRSTIHDALASALERSLPIYAIYVGDTHYTTRGQQALEYLASRSGGRVLYPKASREATALALQLRDSLRAWYSVTYRLPSEANRPGSFHHIRVVARDAKHVRVYSRAGYFQTH